MKFKYSKICRIYDGIHQFGSVCDGRPGGSAGALGVDYELHSKSAEREGSGSERAEPSSRSRRVRRYRLCVQMQQERELHGHAVRHSEYALHDDLLQRNRTHQ